MSNLGPWTSVRVLMVLRDQSKYPDHVPPRVRFCIDQLAEKEMEQAASRLLMGMLAQK